MVLSSLQQLSAQLLDAAPVPAVVAAAHDPHTLEAVFAAERDDLIRPILVGQKDEILDISRKLNHTVDPDSIIDCSDEKSCAREAVALVRAGKGKILIKGLLQTGILLNAVLNPDHGIRVSPLMSHVAILDVPKYHKLLFVTDGGMVVAPGLDDKRHILNNVVELCHFLGYRHPKAAVLCAAETISPRMPETEDAAALKAAALEGDFGSCLVEGPISMDLATDPDSARIKGYHSPVAGDADILLVPSIATGNILCKALYGLAGGKMAGLVLGASVPITVNSRSATAEEKYSSILVCAGMAQERRPSPNDI